MTFSFRPACTVATVMTAALWAATSRETMPWIRTMM